MDHFDNTAYKSNEYPPIMASVTIRGVRRRKTVTTSELTNISCFIKVIKFHQADLTRFHRDYSMISYPDPAVIM